MPHMQRRGVQGCAQMCGSGARCRDQGGDVSVGGARGGRIVALVLWQNARGLAAPPGEAGEGQGRAQRKASPPWPSLEATERRISTNAHISRALAAQTSSARCPIDSRNAHRPPARAKIAAAAAAVAAVTSNNADRRSQGSLHWLRASLRCGRGNAHHGRPIQQPPCGRAAAHLRARRLHRQALQAAAGVHGLAFGTEHTEVSA